MTDPVIQIKSVSFKYKRSNYFALRKISIDINEQDFVVLAGYSGSGKSTLLKCINGLIPHFHAGSFGGEVLIDGASVLKTNTAHLAKKVGFVFQNPENQLSNPTVEREIAFPMENFGIPREEIKKRIDELIKLLSLEDIRFKSPDEISGGEQQLTAIAAALALDPPILVLDEVTAHLSPMSAEKILSLLEKLNKNQGKTIILTEHKLERCIHLANKMAFLEEGRLISSGKTKDVIYNKDFPEEMLPRIPALYKRLEKNGIIFHIKDADSKVLPLTINELVSLIPKE